MQKYSFFLHLIVTLFVFSSQLMHLDIAWSITQIFFLVVSAENQKVKQLFSRRSSQQHWLTRASVNNSCCCWCRLGKRKTEKKIKAEKNVGGVLRRVRRFKKMTALLFFAGCDKHRQMKKSLGNLAFIQYTTRLLYVGLIEWCNCATILKLQYHAITTIEKIG